MDGEERAAAIHCARVYLREARSRARNPAQRGFCFVLLGWAANARRRAMLATSTFRTSGSTTSLNTPSGSCGAAMRWLGES